MKQVFDLQHPDYPEALRQAIRIITNSMRLDFGGLFAKQFEGENASVKKWQYRLLEKLQGLYPQDVLDGYEAITDQKPGHLPTIPEIAYATVQRQRERLKQEQNQVEAERLSALPPPDIKADPKRVFALMREALGGMDGRETEAEKQARLGRLQDKLAAHEALLRTDKAAGRIKTVYLDNSHTCAIGWCLKPGVLCHSTGGGGNFYCTEHYRQ
jgi:hypothetical protein